MARFKAVLKRIFFLPPWLTLLISVPSFALVFIVLSENINGVFAYISYILSAYSLVIAITGAKRIFRGVKQKTLQSGIVQRASSLSIGDNTLGDADFRAKISLYRGFAINIIYAAVKFIAGIRYRSLWFVFFGVYYAMLSLMRLLLLLHLRKGESDKRAEFMVYRRCGVVLLLTTQLLGIIVSLIVYQNHGYEYPGLLIYFMAFYTFFITISAAVRIIRNRRRGSPVISAATAVSLTAALVSMLSLETAMISQFGGGAVFRRTMTAASGGCVCIFVLALSAYMIIRATKIIRKTK